MLKQIPFWQFIHTNLQRNVPVMLLYVLESSGSSPGRQGFGMSVNREGDMVGSVGGGIMEHKFVELAKSALKTGVGESSIHRQLHDKQALKNQSGMICSGEQTIFLYTVQSKDEIPIRLLISSLLENKNATLQLTREGISFSENVPAENYSLLYKEGTDFLYKEKLGYKNHLYIVGGGHCSLALSQLMSGIDFAIHLFEHREGLHTLVQNHSVHESMLLDDYAELSGFIPSGRNHFVVIMTVGYRTDEIALRALVTKDFKYLGILGSKAKIDKMFENLLKEGVSPGKIECIHAPIGLPIHSQTPEEIAVSIAAEIIQVKNQ